MANIREQIEIAKPPSTVFRFCHDTARRAEWDERVVSAKIISTGPVRQGSLIQIDTVPPGQDVFTWDGEYVEFQFPLNSTVKVLDAAPSSPFKAGKETWEFGSTSSGTRFTLEWEYQPRSFIARIADALGKRAATRRDVQRSLQNLKELIEAG